MAAAPRARGERLLVLGAGPAQLGLLEAARRLGLFVVAVDRNAAAPGFPLADRRAVVSSEDEPAVDRLAQAEDVDGIVSPGADWSVGVAARVADRLGLPHPIEPAAAVLATTKTRQRERFAAAGVPQPRIWSEGEEVSFPCVVKAPDRQGQRGLTLVESPAELERAVAVAVAESRTGSYLAEELVDGPEVTVNAVSLDGDFVPLTITDRLTASPPAFGVALAHAWPSEATTPEVADVARRAAEALGIRNGPTYTQVRIGPDGPRVVELAARLGGGHDAELCQAALGYDLNAAAIAFALGAPVARPLIEETQAGGACVAFLVPPEGVLREIVGVEEARHAEGVRLVRIYRGPGHRFGQFRRGRDRAGAVLAVGESRDDALARARAAAERIRFVVE